MSFFGPFARGKIERKPQRRWRRNSNRAVGKKLTKLTSVRPDRGRTMTAVELLRELSGRGVRVRVTGDRLRLRGPQNVLTQNLTERLREHKQAILEVIRSQPACGDCGAAILEQPAWWGRKVGPRRPRPPRVGSPIARRDAV